MLFDFNGQQYVDGTIEPNGYAGYVVQCVGDGDDMRFEHNTIQRVKDAPVPNIWRGCHSYADGVKLKDNFLYINNSNGQFGFGDELPGSDYFWHDPRWSGVGESFLFNIYPGIDYAGNVLLSSALGKDQLRSVFTQPTWTIPDDPTNMANVGWADYLNGDYRLLPSSPYKGHASDGKDVGADIEALEAAQGKVAIHNASPGADGSSATVTFFGT